MTEGNGNFFWDNMLKNMMSNIGKKGVTVWKIVNGIKFKYDLPIKTQGFGAIEPANAILNEYKDRLTETELEFIKKVVKGELM